MFTWTTVINNKTEKYNIKSLLKEVHLKGQPIDHYTLFFHKKIQENSQILEKSKNWESLKKVLVLEFVENLKKV